MLRRSTTCLTVVAVCLAFEGFVTSTRAEDKPDPTGTWKWTFKTPDGQTSESSMTLKKDGDKLTGTVIGRDKQEAKIQDAQFKDGELTVKVDRERDGQKFTVNYKGKLTGDTIKGKISVNIGGEDRSFDWEAKRAKVEKK